MNMKQQPVKPQPVTNKAPEKKPQVVPPSPQKPAVKK